MPRSGKTQDWVMRGQAQMTWPPKANRTLINYVQEMGLDADKYADEDLEGLGLDPAPNLESGRGGVCSSGGSSL
eukprot:5623203-Pleurochrysis_carterae.AAC.1